MLADLLLIIGSALLVWAGTSKWQLGMATFAFGIVVISKRVN